ncbi:recombinase family protein [Emticicia fontis]
MSYRFTSSKDAQKKTTKAVILTRVSDREQEDGYSIEAQKYRLETYCLRHGLKVEKTFEIVESSTVGSRTKFMDMIKFVKSYRETIAIVADKVDRVQRSFKEYPLLDALIQEGRIELHFNTENYIIHKDSVSQERFMWSMGVIMAQSYVDSLRDNVKRSIDHKIRQGEWISLAPFGYLNVKDSRGRGDVILDPDRAPLVEKIFKTYAQGCFTLEEIRTQAIIWGAKNRGNNRTDITRSQIHQILTNPFYYGQMMVKGQLYDHRYPPIVQKNLFDQCRAILKGWNKKRFEWAGKEFVFRGILTCATSGRMVTADTKKKTYVSGKIAEWTYLRCYSPVNPQKIMWVREDLILTQVQAVLKNIQIPELILDRVQQYMYDINKTEQEFLSYQVKELQNEYQKVQNRLDTLMDLLLDGTIEKGDFEGKKAKLRGQQIELENQIASHRFGDDGFKDSLISLLTLLTRSYEFFMAAEISEKRKILNLIFANLSLKGSSLCYTLRKPFELFINVPNSEEWLPLVDRLRTQLELRFLIVSTCDIYSVKEIIKHFN